ncbi:MAG: hypothetical protein ABIH92_04545 [Nanoarchaeota archaeon]
MSCSTGGHSIIRKTGKKVKVKVDTLDAVLKKQGIKKVDLNYEYYHKKFYQPKGMAIPENYKEMILNKIKD